jgi:hypothetical protein
LFTKKRLRVTIFFFSGNDQGIMLFTPVSGSPPARERDFRTG